MGTDMANWNGNVILGRQDIEYPEPLCAADLARFAQVVLVPAPATKTVWVASLRGRILGYVTRRFGGEMYRLPGAALSDWRYAASRWHPNDPARAHAVLALLDGLAA